MTAPVSPHFPILAGGIESVVGTFEVDTGLRKLQSFAANLVASSVTANEESKVTWLVTSAADAASVKVTLYVWKGGTADGSAGDSAVDVSWIALGE